MEQLAATYPEVVTLVNAGKSFEGRDIKYVKISSTNFQVSKILYFIFIADRQYIYYISLFIMYT